VLQEIEGDAVFLYAADPGPEQGWDSVLQEVSEKLASFFEAFINQLGVGIEATQCPCAICSNADKLGLKIIVHVGEAIFHEGGGRHQVSGPDVILAHRLLKNSVDSKEYLLLTEAAFAAMGKHLEGSFEKRREVYDDFEPVDVRVRELSANFLNARDAVYHLDDLDLKNTVDAFTDWVIVANFRAMLQQLRNPIRSFGFIDKLLMVFDLFKWRILYGFIHRPSILTALRARGKRRTNTSVENAVS
jgi:hypothetical protein